MTMTRSAFTKRSTSFYIALDRNLTSCSYALLIRSKKSTLLCFVHSDMLVQIAFDEVTSGTESLEYFTNLPTWIYVKEKKRELGWMLISFARLMDILCENCSFIFSLLFISSFLTSSNLNSERIWNTRLFHASLSTN
jgi:hypothetical protein